jgi:hypothetical protein
MCSLSSSLLNQKEVSLTFPPCAETVLAWFNLKFRQLKAKTYAKENTVVL